MRKVKREKQLAASGYQIAQNFALIQQNVK